MSDQKKPTRFIRKNGRIIPIAAAAAGGTAGAYALKAAKATNVATRAYRVGHGVKTARTRPEQPVEVNRALDLGSLGLSVASGVVGAATFTGGAKKIVGGMLGSYGLDAAGIAANAASVARGKGAPEDKAKQLAKQEARNFLVGNAVYAAGLLGVKKNREAIGEGAGMVAKGAGKVLNLARKALRVRL